ncbi:Zn(II)2Cys6 transcription factor [Sporobolomyces salmoneus]|uniref:Zn(II)2Cys6 transcription factor n=1 Tax=Sporobolomyces salmoneus TaxID=183962 RepID=UPI003179C92E
MSVPPYPFPPTASTSSLSPDASTSSGNPGMKQKKTRTRNGCLTCRARKKRCDEQRPKCNGCSRLALDCQWEDKEKAAIERREKREQRKRERASKKQEEGTQQVGKAAEVRRKSGPMDEGEGGAKMEIGNENGEDLQGLEALATAGLISSMSEYPPPAQASSSGMFHYSPHDRPMPQLHHSPQNHSWTGFLGSFAPGPSDVGWTTSFPQLNAPSTPQIEQTNLIPHPTSNNTNTNGQTTEEQEGAGVPQLSDVDITSWLNHGDLPLTFSSLVRSRSPSPARPFDPDLSALFPSFGDFDVLNLPPDALDHFTLNHAANPPILTESQALVPQPPQNPSPAASSTSSTTTTKRFPTAVTRAASFLASSDFAFTQAYLLSHYTTSLAQHVSIASSTPSNPSSPASPRPPRSRRNSTSASANLFLSLIPHAHRNPFLMHSILSWSSANLAAASSISPPGTATGGAGNHSAMGSLSDELGALAEGLLEEVIPRLERKKANEEEESERGRTTNRGESSPKGKQKEGENVEFEPVLAGVLMLCQAAICRGDVEKWRERLRQAAQVITLVGGLSECRSPLARQLVRNLLYHDVLSSSSSKHGLLLDYSSLRPPATTTEGATPASSKNSTVDTNGREEMIEEGEDEEVLDTLMGIAEPVFLLIGRITSLAREKHEATKRSGGMIPEEELSTFLRKVDDVRGELELEKARVDSFVVERPDLEPHRYFHEVFRLCGLLYLQMICEMPPRSLPVLLLVRKMLNLIESIVAADLPGLCSCHFALYIMHLNSTPLTSPHSQLNDRQRSARVFDHHMQAFAFLNTKRSRALVDEAWRRSEDGKLFVDPDAILEEWKWSLNWA